MVRTSLRGPTGVAAPLGLALGLALGVSLSYAGSVAAQSRSIFSMLDTQGRSVAPATSADGALTDDDVISPDGRRVQVWALRAEPGAELQVDLRSADFDAFLYAVGPGLGDGLRDDDGGDGLNSRLCLQLDQAGEYRLVASSYSGETGRFTLAVSEAPGVSNGACPAAPAAEEITDIAELPTEGRVLTLGDEIDGTLGDGDPMLFGSPAEAWEVEGQAGEPFSVDLISDAFDAYLMVEGPGLEEWLQDDDGAGACDSRLTFTFPQTGTYRVVASTLGQSGGPFRMIATREPGPENPEACSHVDVPTTPEASNVDAEAIPVVGELADGLQAAGQMTGNESLFEGRYVQAWTFQGSAGDRVSVELRSADFDSYLHFIGPGFPDHLDDDDGGGNLNSRICVDLPEDGTYRVLAGPLSGVDAGDRYTVTLRNEATTGTLCDSYQRSPVAVAADLVALPTEGRSIGVNESRDGVLETTAQRHPTDDRPIQPWSFEAPGGQSVWVDVVSEDFDPLLYVVGPTIVGDLFNDDDADTEGCQTRLEIGPDVSGPVTLLVGAYYGQANGSFTLRTSTDPGPLETGGCVDAASGATSADPSVLVALSSGEERPIQVGTEVSGELSDVEATLPSGEPAQSWSFTVREGDDLIIELMSSDFDPVLYLDGAGLFTPLRDDDGLGVPNSLIEYTAAEGGRMRIVVSAYEAGATGSFRLRVIRKVN